MGSNVQHQCGHPSVNGMSISTSLLVCYIWFQLFIIFMCFKMFNGHFFKNLEEKIQRCLGLLVGDNRLGKLNFLVTFMTRQIKSQFNSAF